MGDMSPDPTPVAARNRAPRRTAVKATSVRRASNRSAAGRIMSKAQMVAKVREEVGLYLDLMQAGWEIRDPECAASATPERVAAVADRLTNMIARNDSALEFASKTGIIGDIVALLHALVPIGREVWRNHGPGGVGHKSVEEVSSDYAARFPAYGHTG